MRAVIIELAHQLIKQREFAPLSNVSLIVITNILMITWVLYIKTDIQCDNECLHYITS